MVEYEAGDKIGDKGYLVLRGELVGDVSDEDIAKEIEHHYVDDGVTSIVVDVSDLDGISLEGVWILLRLLERSERRGKRFLVEHPHGQVEEKLEVTGILGMLTEPL